MTNNNLLINLLITARDQASDTLKGVVGSMRDLLAQVIAWGAAFLSFGSSIDAAAKLEEQMGKLRGVIEATGGAAGLTAEDIDEMARRLGDTSAIRDAAALLLTFKSVSKDVFERTLKAAQDLSATGFGSIEQASVQLGKALENPLAGLGALTEVGVSFDAQQKELIKNFVSLGKTAEAQKIILAAVEGQVKGVADASGAGLADAVEAVDNQLTALKETVGGNLLGVWTQLNLQFAEFINQAKRAAGEGTILKDAMVLLGTGITVVGGAFQIAGTAIGNFFAAVANRDFSQFNQAMEEANLRIRGQVSAMAALSDKIGPVFALTADEAKRLASLTGQVATQTQQAGAAAGTAASQVSALASSYKENYQVLELLQAVLDRRLSAQDAWNAVRREEAKLSGDISTQLALEISIAEQDVRTKQDQANAAARLASEAQRYYDQLKNEGAASKEETDRAAKDAVAKQKQADATAAAASAAAVYYKQAKQAPLTQSLETQNQQLQITLDYEARIAAVRNKNLSQATQDANNFSAAIGAISRATLARLSVSDKASAAERKAAQATTQAYLNQADTFARQVQDGEQSILLLSQLQGERIKLLQETADAADVTAMVKADDKPARQEMRGFIEWANRQEIVIPVRLSTGGAGGGLNGLVDSLTRGAAAQ